MDDKKYISLFKEIEDKSLEELNEKFPIVVKAYRKMFKEMEIYKRTYGRNYNELLVSNPNIQAVFCYSKDPRMMSSYMRRYAEKHDLHIVVLG